MLKRDQNKMAFQNMDPSKDPVKMLRMTGLDALDDATLLGALLDLKASDLTEDDYNRMAELIDEARRKGT